MCDLIFQEISGDPKFFVEGASFDDFSQGTLGNCWFVAACACLTADRKLLTKVSICKKVIYLFMFLFGSKVPISTYYIESHHMIFIQIEKLSTFRLYHYAVQYPKILYAHHFDCVNYTFFLLLFVWYFQFLILLFINLKLFKGVVVVVIIW